MKRFSFLLMAGLMALGFGACSDEVDVSKDNETEAQKVHMSFKLELPSSRSATDTGGDTNSNPIPDFEVGKDYENNVKRVDVVLANVQDGKYNYIATSSNGTLTGAGTNYTVTFQTDQLESFAEKSVAVFVFCNSKVTDFSTIFSTNESMTVSAINDITDKENSGFLMSNAEITTVNLPSKVDMLSYHNTVATAFNLGTVKVERSAARFDYKAGGIVENEKNTHKYALEEDADKNPTVLVELKEIALTNWSKNFYYLRRVADASEESVDKYNPDAIEICGKELPYSDVNGDNIYVLDTDHSSKLVKTAGGTNNFFNAISGDDAVNLTNFWSTLEQSEKTSLINITEEDNWKGETPTVDGYNIWRYATENTLPSKESQIISQSTGVLFKGVLDVIGEDDQRLSGEKAYVFGNKLYGKWSDVAAKIENVGTDAELLTLKNAYEQVDAITKAKLTGTNTYDDPDASDAAKAGFTVYTKENNDFNVYYYYKNRHNDNGDNTNMIPMEFAVVRNNVYKLSVTNIVKFGHPGDPSGDPDPIDPDDPDEEKEVYFRVGVKVLPWVVRVNNIEF